MPAVVVLIVAYALGGIVAGVIAALVVVAVAIFVAVLLGMVAIDELAGSISERSDKDKSALAIARRQAQTNASAASQTEVRRAALAKDLAARSSAYKRRIIQLSVTTEP